MLHFTPRHTYHLQLHSVIHAPFLGRIYEVTIDKDLKFKNAHLINIARREEYRAYVINKCFASRDRSTLLRAFAANVRPLLEYASNVWYP